MRPRVFPAEDRNTQDSRTRGYSCFNEAAGIPRGRRMSNLSGKLDEVASMRPRVFPAEDAKQRLVAGEEEPLQ